MKKYLLLFLLTNLTVCAQSWKLVWSDEFDGKELNLKNWNYETGNGEGGWGTGQMDYCTDRPENVKVSKGKLILGITKEEINGFHYTAGRINSKNKVTARYGRIEAKIKIPAGRGIGAAFWMLPQDERYGWWPRSGEIDILETNGHEVHRNYGTVHYMLSEQRKYTGHDIIKEQNDLSKEFHVYGIEWDEKAIRWFLDDSVYHSFPIVEPVDGRAPFHENFFFILSAGVGSDFSGKDIEDKLLPQTFEFEYVRVYKKVVKPVLQKAISSSDGQTLELRFNEQIRPDVALSAFQIEGEGKTIPVISVASKYRENNVLLVKLADPIQSGDYIVSISPNTIKTADDIFSDVSQRINIINTTTDAVPVLMDAKVSEDCFSIEVTGSKVFATAPSYKGFSIFKNGDELKTTAIFRDSLRLNKLIVSVTDPFMKDDSIYLIYKDGNVKSEQAKPLINGNLAVENKLPFKTILPGRLEAENYLVQSGVQRESTSDVGGGDNLGYIDDKDWMEYLVYIKEDGKYQLNFRAAVMNYNATVKCTIGTIKTSTVLNQTFGWQTWKDTKGAILDLKKGVYRFKCDAERGGFNLNWINFERIAEDK